MDRNVKLTAAQLFDFENLLAEKLGFLSDGARRDQLEEILIARLRATGSVDAFSYFSFLQNPAHTFSELQLIADQIAVKETYFFRGLDHYQAFVKNVLPALLALRADSRRLRILCAGCSSGEEPYTLAILLREENLFDDGWEVDILGIDISPAVIEKARRGRFTPWSLRNTADAIKARYFHSVGQQFELVEDIRRNVRFEVRNLLDNDSLFWHPGAFDVIFCRNVFIYFTVSAFSSVVNQFAQSLIPGGYLFLGHSETLRGISRAYHLCNEESTFYYQRRHPHEPLEPYATFELWQEAIHLNDEDSAPLPLIPDDSWVDATQRISERIKEVTSTPRQTVAAPTVQPLDWGHVMELYSLERYTDVERLLEVPAKTGNQDALLILAAVLTNHGQLERAEKVCNALIAADEFNAGASYLLALCREHGGDLTRAELHLQSAAYLDPQFAMPHLQLGRLARRLGKIDVAQRYFHTALDLLKREDSARLLLFGGGFSRDMLSIICRDELIACGGKE